MIHGQTPPASPSFDVGGTIDANIVSVDPSVILDTRIAGTQGHGFFDSVPVCFSHGTGAFTHCDNTVEVNNLP